jgi:osmotically-inducible protein OsmY
VDAGRAGTALALLIHAEERDIMSTATLSDTDVSVRDAVVTQLDWDPEIDASAVGVAARGGVVTLTGYVGTYSEKLVAERIAKRVRGVRGVANEIEVKLRQDITDPDLARDVVRALSLRSTIPPSVQAVVHNGHVTLTGLVDWLFQKEEAEKAVRHVRGVRGVFNHIDVKARATEKDVRHRIVEALHRNADVDARHVTVAIDGGVATLRGRVGSFMQYEAAARAAASAPGITSVDNQLQIGAVPD